MRLPPRRTLRLIVQDAIDDRREMLRCDRDAREATQARIDALEDLSARLADDAPPLSETDRDTLALACGHARVWRDGLVASWSATGDRAQILAHRQEVDQVTRTERALGVIPEDASGHRYVPIQELRRNPAMTFGT